MSEQPASRKEHAPRQPLTVARIGEIHEWAKRHNFSPQQIGDVELNVVFQLAAAALSERPLMPTPEAINAALEWEAGVSSQDIDVNAMVAYILHQQPNERSG